MAAVTSGTPHVTVARVFKTKVTPFYRRFARVLQRSWSRAMEGIIFVWGPRSRSRPDMQLNRAGNARLCPADAQGRVYAELTNSAAGTTITMATVCCRRPAAELRASAQAARGADITALSHRCAARERSGAPRAPPATSITQPRGAPQALRRWQAAAGRLHPRQGKRRGWRRRRGRSPTPRSASLAWSASKRAPPAAPAATAAAEPSCFFSGRSKVATTVEDR
jgi:hypothetical protein